MNKVALHTLGCKLNFSETSAIGEQFRLNGFQIVEFKENADVYVFNTCSVTENAEKECRQFVRRALRQNPDAFVVVTGCYAQLRPEEISKIGGVDLILGAKEKFRLLKYLNPLLIEEKKPSQPRLSCIYVSPVEELNEFGPSYSGDPDIIGRTRAFLKIQDGCDYKCSFCTIPLARGKSRSMNPDEIETDFKKLLAAGYKEIVLTGVNVGDYGRSHKTNLYQLLLKLTEIPGEFRIRISSIEPNLLSDEIIDLTAGCEKLCRHFHIPLQSGSSKILGLMQRRYRAEFYEEIINKCAQRIPELGIGADVITGFPGETETDFKTTHDFLINLPISYLHVFTYSERPKTKAIKYEGVVDIFDRRRRTNILRMLSRKKKNEFYKNMIGKELEILPEAENKDGIMKGFSSNYVKVQIPFSSELINEFIRIRISSVDDNICSGEIIKTSIIENQLGINNSVDSLAVSY
ncbi:MAG TPA: tRNA (N(6)-L-threonylcarbamoyladenosine(37)-C(2))-methylthiotransferase MtaB [Ignavibacteriaceae bacterium]|nr:tRNA (N(6)-L-threonylcarbamoyladenosine(37)-C(2))-methylthiotransferase MtaB [Ignavibacteriaceae bacterium]